MTHPQPLAQNATPAAVADADPAAALGRIPSGLFVVAWRVADQDRALLASWIMQAGFVPPTISVAVATTRDLLAALDTDARFSVSVLGEPQRSLVGRFAKPAAEPFAGLDVRRTASGVAVLADAAAWLECRPLARAASGGDHVVVVAEVLATAAAEGRTPLVHTRKNGLRY
jgi:flavin reductase (DIM6/NTAB) family NADH-FMN oxidoreductase RutF